MFLIEHLPKDTDKEIVSGQKGLSDEILQNIAHVVQKQLSAPFLHAQCKPNGMRLYDNEILCIEGHPRQFHISYIKPITVPQPYLLGTCQGNFIKHKLS